jgi:hypothetical protein
MKAHLLLAAILVAGCSDQNVNLGGNYRVAAFVPPIENHSIDLLFVVDSSPSMADNQAQLAAHAKDALFDVISAAIGDMPDLHVGVITPDMPLGVGIGDPNCDGPADNGALLIGACTGITDNYLVDVDDGAGGRITNYTGTLDEAFGCIANVGINGCGYEQPLAALEAALTNPANTGFLRPEALLVVVVLTDEDDCSAGSGLFDPANGPPGSYRCFREAMQCNEDLDTPGVKTDCFAREDSLLMTPLADLHASLVAAKGGDPTKVMVAAITGPNEPVEVGVNVIIPDALDLIASCVDTTDPSLPAGWAYPAIRLHEFLDQFPGLSWADSICAAVDPTAALARTANSVGDLAGARPCLRGDLKDVDADAAGVQPSCRVFLATDAFRPTEVRRELDACEGDGSACFQITTDAATCGHWSGLAVELVGVNQGPTDDLIAECIIP